METCERCGRTFKNTHGLNIHKTRGHGDPFAHGRHSTYRNYSCRCGPCTDAKSDFDRAARRRKKADA